MIKNLTPHTIDICVDGKKNSISPEPVSARCRQSQVVVAEVDGIPVTRQTYGEVYGLPAPADGVFLVVSRLVAAACPDRKDLLVPGPLVRDSKGIVVGCDGLSML